MAAKTFDQIHAEVLAKLIGQYEAGDRVAFVDDITLAHLLIKAYDLDTETPEVASVAEIPDRRFGKFAVNCPWTGSDIPAWYNLDWASADED